jgi:hypothetical protein
MRKVKKVLFSFSFPLQPVETMERRGRIKVLTQMGSGGRRKNALKAETNAFQFGGKKSICANISTMMENHSNFFVVSPSARWKISDVNLCANGIENFDVSLDERNLMKTQ